MQVLVEAVSLFFPLRGGDVGGPAGDSVLIGPCTCGGVLRMVSVGDGGTKRRIDCSSAMLATAFGNRNCAADLPTMWITNSVFRSFEVRQAFSERCCRIAHTSPGRGTLFCPLELQLLQ